MQLTKTIILAIFGLGATAFAMPADAAVASAGNVAAPAVNATAADPPFCDRYRRGDRDYPRECDRRGNCDHRDWRERGRDCPRPRECEGRDWRDEFCRRWY